VFCFALLVGSDALGAGLNYLVHIDDQGRLHWARNDELVDTSAGHWKDAGAERGIVPIDAEDLPNVRQAVASGSSGSLSSGELSAEDRAATHYVGAPKGSNKLSRTIHRNLTLKGLFDKLLRKTLRHNTWIYVAVSYAIIHGA
jgi:hypothetical protein